MKKITLNDGLLLVRNREEALLLLSATLVSSQIESTIEATRLSVEHQLLLGVLQQDVRAHGNPLSTTLLPLLACSRRQVQDCIDSHLKVLQKLTDECNQVHASLQLFGSQNLALSEELKATGNKQLAQQKLSLGKLEMDMCKKILLDLAVATHRGRPAGGSNGECTVKLPPLRMVEQQINQQCPMQLSSSSSSSSSSHGGQVTRNNQNQGSTAGNDHVSSGNAENIPTTDTNAAGCRLKAVDHGCSLNAKRNRDEGEEVDGGGEVDEGRDHFSKRRHVTAELLCQHAHLVEINEALGRVVGKKNDNDDMITTPTSSQTMFSAGKDVSITSTKAEFGTANSSSDHSGVKPNSSSEAQKSVGFSP